MSVLSQLVSGARAGFNAGLAPNGGLTQQQNAANKIIGGIAGASLAAYPNQKLGASTNIAVGGGSGQDAAQANLVRQMFNTRRASLGSQMSALQPQQDAAQAQVANSWQTQKNTLDKEFARGQGNLTQSRQQVDAAKTRSLQNLRDSVIQKSQGYANQLGAFGAGNSSAAGMINFALAQEGSRNRGDVLQNASQQYTEISQQEQKLKDDYDSNIGALNNWKQQSLFDIVTKFEEQRNAIRNAMATADYEEQVQLAQYDQANTQSAIQKLQALEGQFNQQATDLTARYQNIFAPQEIAISPEYQNYAVRPIDAGTLDGLRMPTQVNPEDGLTAILKRRQDEQLANPLGV